ncbi:MAG: hypothetical protein KF685_11755 [Acidobacteria bacterium]|nr:hypothetical protein [Acidobacteriota bacterium]
MREHFQPFIDDLKATHGKNLVSVILYGSAAAGDFIQQRSDYNILIALDHIKPADLREANACVREWHKLGHPVPVYFTVDEIRGGADVFPIEFHQMQKAHKVLYGPDVLAGVEVHDDFLRHQIEYELRSKLLLLRRQYIPASETSEGLKRLMGESLTSFSALLAASLLLFGVEPPVTKPEILARAEKYFGLDPEPFDRILALRRNDYVEKIDEAEANKLFGSYLEQIEKVIRTIDEAKVKDQ